MKVVSGMTDVVSFPIEETNKIADAMEQAEKAGDLEGLKWCSRFFLWLWDEGEVMGSDSYCYAEGLFNKTWAMLLKNDPPPESIAAIVNRKDEPAPPTAADAGKALDTVKAFFEENLARKGLDAALKSVESLRGAVKTAEAGQ